MSNAPLPTGRIRAEAKLSSSRAYEIARRSRFEARAEGRRRFARHRPGLRASAPVLPHILHQAARCRVLGYVVILRWQRSIVQRTGAAGIKTRDVAYVVVLDVPVNFLNSTCSRLLAIIVEVAPAYRPSRPPSTASYYCHRCLRRGCYSIAYRHSRCACHSNSHRAIVRIRRTSTTVGIARFPVTPRRLGPS